MGRSQSRDQVWRPISAQTRQGYVDIDIPIVVRYRSVKESNLSDLSLEITCCRSQDLLVLRTNNVLYRQYGGS